MSHYTMGQKTSPRQIAHIKQHLGAFQEQQCHFPPYGNNGIHGVEEYFHDLSHIPDLYLNLCNDLNIKPVSAVE